MTNSEHTAAVTAVIAGYVDACRTGDVEKLQAQFHPQAAMNGLLAGNLLIGNPEPFFDAVASNPAPADTGAVYETEISDIVIGNNIATGTLTERGFMGLNFVNHFQLLHSEGEWKIVAKLFESL
ncbi:MAG: nuclear transport factor 2 family protein [Pseudomonadota bacterium]